MMWEWTAALVISGSILSPALGAGPAGAMSPQNHAFSKMPKVVCALKGEWADGEPFHYQSWDTCSKTKVRRGNQATYAAERPRGSDKRLSGKDIPAGGEVIEVSNDHSVVIVFRDEGGRTREILIRD